MRPFQPAPSRSLAFKAHAALWSVAGLASAAYIGWLTVGPSTFVAMTGNRDRPRGADGRSFESALTQLTGDVRALHGKLAADEDTSHALLGRVAALEEKSAFAAASAAPPAATPRTDTPSATRATDNRPQVAAVAPRSSEITTGAILQRTATSPAPTMPRAPEHPVPAMVTTTSFPEVEAAAARPLAQKSALGLQLSAGPNLDSLRLNWSLLHERHRDLLGPMQIRYRKVAGRPNAPYQLIAGPVRSPAEAARICKALATSGVSCRTTTYSGEAL